jgi:alpha-galactosidase
MKNKGKRMKNTIIAAVISLMSVVSSQAADKPLKVFILAGQSNMEGHGKVEEGRNPDYDPKKQGSEPEIVGGLGSLRSMVNNPATAAKYKHLVDAKGQWVERNDAWIYTADNKKGKLSVGYGSNGVWIGPELGFGFAVADYCKDPILIIKTAWGGKSLGVDFRPPSSGNSKFAGEPGDEGKCYREMIRIVKDVCANVETHFPELKGHKIEFAGLGWNQGWNDQYDPAMVAEYDKNMANLIKDVRKELNAPNLPFVIADTGQLGPGTGGELATLCEIQMAMGDPKKHPEFAGTVASVETRGFARTAKDSPSDFDYHWNHNGESHYLVGEAMGQAMVKLIGRKK